MKNKLQSFLILALIVNSTVLLSSFSFLPMADNGDWVKFSDTKKAKFEVLLPQKAKASKDKDNWFISSTLSEPLTNFYVGVTFYKLPFTDQGFRDDAQAYMDGIAKTVNEKFAAPTEMQFNGGLCLEYNYTSLGMKSVKRIFYKGNIRYELTVNPITGDIPKAEMDKFFGSFKYLK
jgi:hypothetical protein